VKEQEEKIWHTGVLGMTLNVDEGRITIFRSTLEVLGWPSYYRFLYNPQMNQIAVQVCSAADAGAHRVGKLNEFSSCEMGIGCEPIRFDSYTQKKMTFFFDPDGLPLELHE